MNLLNDVTAARAEAAEQRRRDADAAVERAAHAAQLALRVEAARRESARQDRLSAEQARAEQDAAKAARKDASKARSGAAWRARGAIVLRLADRAQWVLPIAFPMAVAWVGQIHFAEDVLGWPTPGAVLFAAALELSTAYVARLDWMSRQDGDSALIFRAATWAFAIAAAGMNYGHFADPDFEPNQTAVTYGLMSLSGIVLWELYSIFKHRKHERDNGRRPQTLPRFGMARWVNFPLTTWVARREAIRSGHTSAAAAWSAAVAYWEERASTKKAKKHGKGPADIKLVAAPDVARTAMPNTSLPAERPADVRPVAAPDAAKRAPRKAEASAPAKPAKTTPRRPVEETRKLASEALSAVPGTTRKAVAVQLDISDRHVRRVLKEPSGEQAIVPSVRLAAYDLPADIEAEVMNGHPVGAPSA